MKLVELLAAKLENWADTTACYVQDPNGVVYPCVSTPEFCNQWAGASGFIDQNNEAISTKMDLSSDYSTAIIKKAQWQAERDRQKGGEWIRARGRKPKYETETPQRMEVRHRDGDITKGWTSQAWNWSHNDGAPDADIMAWRIISQPQAEEVEMNKLCMGEKCSATAENISHSSECEAEHEASYNGTWCQSSGPLAWRDTIIHCQAIIEDCEREIQRNVDLLDAEGLMMQVDSKKAMQAYDVDMSDWRNLRIGDVVECLPDGAWMHRWQGKHVTIKEVEVKDYDGDLPICATDDTGTYDWGRGYKFISRP